MRDAVAALTQLIRRAVCGHATSYAFRARRVAKAVRATAVQIRATPDAHADGGIAKLAVARCAIGIHGALDAHAAGGANFVRRAISGGGAGLGALAADRITNVAIAAIAVRDALHAHALRRTDRRAAIAVGRAHARQADEEPGAAARAAGRSEPKARK
jgi:hypothetical protein